MKLFFDARYIRTDFHVGISRYAAQLGSALANIADVTFIICDEQQKTLLPKAAKTVMLHTPTSWKEPFSAFILNKYQPDVVVSPMQTIGSIGRRFTLVLTLHDMIYYHYRTPPKEFAWPIRLGWYVFHLSYWPQRMTLNRADIVATVSQTSREDILAARLTKRPIVVTPNAPESLEKYVKKRTTNAPRNLLYMGSFMGYKNVETLITAMKDLPEYTLHCLSRISKQRHEELHRLIPDKAHVVFHGGVSDETYAKLLTHNSILVTASQYEGYGLPVVEALSLGAPAVVSDIPIFHEVAGHGALYFNPESPQSFAQQVRRLDDRTTRQKLAKDGARHIRQFNWDDSAKTLLDAITSLE